MAEKRTSDLDLTEALDDDDEVALVQLVSGGGGTKVLRRAKLSTWRTFFGVDALEARIAALEAGPQQPQPSVLGDTLPFTLA